MTEIGSSSTLRSQALLNAARTACVRVRANAGRMICSLEASLVSEPGEPPAVLVEAHGPDHALERLLGQVEDLVRQQFPAVEANFGGFTLGSALVGLELPI